MIFNRWESYFVDTGIEKFLEGEIVFLWGGWVDVGKFILCENDSDLTLVTVETLPDLADLKFGLLRFLVGQG